MQVYIDVIWEKLSTTIVKKIAVLRINSSLHSLVLAGCQRQLWIGLLFALGDVQQPRGGSGEFCLGNTH